MRWIQERRIYLAWVIALVALLGSLYYGEVMNFEPCRLCWYQRICMFPLPLFLGIAWYKDEEKLAFYTLPLIAMGFLLAGYQSLITLFPALQIASLCSESAPCTLTSYAPFLSLLGFGAIGALIYSKTRFF